MDARQIRKMAARAKAARAAAEELRHQAAAIRQHVAERREAVDQLPIGDQERRRRRRVLDTFAADADALQIRADDIAARA